MIPACAIAGRGDVLLSGGFACHDGDKLEPGITMRSTVGADMPHDYAAERTA